MKPFRWAFLIASLFMVHGWLVEHDDELNAWAESSRAVDVLLGAAKALLGGPSAVVVGLFARIRDNEVLENASRQKIHDYVVANPGSSLTEVAAGVGFGWGTTVHHLRRLEEAKLVRSYADGRRKAFVVEGPTAKWGAAHLPRTDPARQRLLDALVQAPGASQGELATRAGLSLPLANRHLRVLERVGLVASTKTWRTRTYELSTVTRSQISPMEQRATNTLSGVSPLGTSSG